MIIGRFGVDVLPFVSGVLGIGILLGTMLKFQNLIFLIPQSISYTLKSTIGESASNLGLLIILNEIVRAFGIRGHPNNVRFFDVWKYVAEHFDQAKWIMFVIYILATSVLVYCVKRFRNLPWFLAASFLAILAGYFLGGAGIVNIIKNSFQGGPELITLLDNHIHHLINFDVFVKKVLKGEFIMNMLFFTVATFLESVTTIRVARMKQSEQSDRFSEMLGLGFTNCILGLLGLLPVGIPLARNILAAETGGNHKLHLLFAGTILFLLSFILWPVMQYFPTIAISIFNSCLGMLMIDFWFILALVRSSPILIIPISVLLVGSLFIDVLMAFNISLVLFYLMYFNIGGKEYYCIEKTDLYFEGIGKAQSIISLQPEEEEERVGLNALPLGVTRIEADEVIEDEFEMTKQNFIEDGVVYTLLGTFNFFNYEVHYNNIRYFNKTYVCLNFSEIIGHDIDFLPEYRSLIELIDESGYECYISGFSKERMLKDRTLRRVNWLLAKDKEGKLLFSKKR